jgi:hypothetical protein
MPIGLPEAQAMAMTLISETSFADRGPGSSPGRSLRWYFASFSSFADLVVFARSYHPIPSRTRPLNSSAPMVLSLKAWKSRSLPGLPRTKTLLMMMAIPIGRQQWRPCRLWSCPPQMGKPPRETAAFFLCAPRGMVPTLREFPAGVAQVRRRNGAGRRIPSATRSPRGCPAPRSPPAPRLPPYRTG